MKKFSLTRFSLQRQLIIIFGSVCLLIIAFLIPVINNNLTSIIDFQMYDVLDDAQRNYLKYDFVFPSNRAEEEIIHMTYYESDGTSNFEAVLNRDFAVDLYRLIESPLTEMLNSDIELIEGKGYIENELMYYRIVEKDVAGEFVVTFAYSDYSNDLVAALQQEIINVFYVALIILGGIIFIWVTAMIKPLRMIRIYINGIKLDKRKELKIERGDEIGIVAKNLVEMDQELQIQNQTKEEMIHNISHDLKTPIALIKTYGESIKDGIYPYGTMEASMDVILENATRLDSKVKSLLYLNRLEYMKHEVQREEFDMKELIETIVKQMQTMYPDIEVELYLNEIMYVGDQEHWRICLENILENAYRYVKSKIVITLNKQNLEIFNDGLPIEEEFLDELFKPYRKGVKGQFGLGLSIVSKTVELYDYKVTAKNDSNGVSFIIYK